MVGNGLESYSNKFIEYSINCPFTVKKKGAYGPELIWHFDTQLAKNTQLRLSGLYVKAHEV